MKKIDELKLLPSRFFVGIDIPNEKILKNANLTKYQAGVYSAVCKNGVQIIYSVNTKTASIPLKPNSEIHVLLIDVESDEYKLKVLKTIAKTVQRGIPYQLILIMRNNDKYRIVLPIFRKAKHQPNVILVEKLYVNNWGTLERLRFDFSHINDILRLEKFETSEIMDIIKKRLHCYEGLQEIESNIDERSEVETVTNKLVSLFGLEKVHEMILRASNYTSEDEEEIDGLMHQIDIELDYIDLDLYNINKYDFLDEIRAALSGCTISELINQVYDYQLYEDENYEDDNE